MICYDGTTVTWTYTIFRVDVTNLLNLLKANAGDDA